MSARPNLPQQYNAYIQHLADEMKNMGIVADDFEQIVFCAAINLLADHFNSISPSESKTEVEDRWQYLVEIAEVRDEL